MTTLRQLLNFDAGLRPLSSLSTFRSASGLPNQQRARTLSAEHSAKFPTTHGTANTNLSEKWLLPAWQQTSTLGWKD